MDNAVALVRAYLHVNGYFTVTEFPVLEAIGSGGYRTATDVDVLAFRFPLAGLTVSGAAGACGGGRTAGVLGPDPALGAPSDRPDMIVGEVKEGRACVNEAAWDPAVLGAVLARFGCCEPGHTARVAEELLRKGRAETPCGHRVRVVAFGSTPGGPTGGHRYTTVSMGHVVRFLQEQLRGHWEVLGQAQLKDPAFGFLATVEKALRGSRE
ncbi:MAG TPA: hypothetical protein VNZ44_20790 [Pyrinomonadaceae bacterium]|nr:hypothetical protein [Pyrinomonadaceae bacterium]